MLLKRNYLTAATAFVVALGTGYVMQNGVGGYPGMNRVSAAGNSETPRVSKVELAAATQIIPAATGAAPSAPQKFPDEAAEPAPLQNESDAALPEQIATPAAATPAAPDSDQAYNSFGIACDISLSAAPAPAAMVALELDAPCHEREAVTIRHGDLVFDSATSVTGLLSVTVPALTREAAFEVEFLDGVVVTASTEVPEVDAYDRVALQWSGDSGLGINAFEFGAGYGDQGHVSINAPRNADYAAEARGGFLTRLGSSALPQARQVEVYSFPSGLTSGGGLVRISVDAEVTAQNCGREVQAEALQPDAQGQIAAVGLTLYLPECDAVGEFLVLKNLLRDMKVAQY